MFDNLILTPALLCTQNHLLISADPGSCAVSQTTYAHMHGHLRAHKGFITEENCSQIYGTGCNYGGDGESGEQDRAGKLCSLFALQRHEALLRWRGEHGPGILIPSAMHRQAPSVTHLHPLTCSLVLLSLKVSQLPSLMHPSLSFLPVCQVLITSLSQRL